MTTFLFSKFKNFMMRFYLPILLIILYNLWVITKIIKHRSIKRFKSEIFFGLFFSIIWIIIYNLLI